MSDTLAISIQSAATSVHDGRTAFPRFRQAQLGLLHNVLLANRAEVVAAVCTDSGRVATEAKLELALALSKAKECFQTVDFAATVKRDAADYASGVVRKPVGMVAIAANPNAPILSLVEPLGATIAHGNSAVVILGPGYPTLNSVLINILAALDRQSFVFLEPASNSDHQLATLLAFAPALIITPTLSSTLRAQAATHSTTVHAANKSTRSGTVIVDRSHSVRELERIARLVVRGKYFGLGTLDGSVDRVLVHADKAGEFIELVLQEAKEAYGADASLSADYGRVRTEGGMDRLDGVVRKAVDGGDGVVLLGGSKGKGDFFPPTIVAAKPSFASHGVRGPVLPIYTFNSLEGALALQARSASSVLYLFATAANVKYLVQGSSATSVYIGEIPISALYQPRTDAYALIDLTTTATVHLAAITSDVTVPLFAPLTPTKLAVVDSLLLPQRKVVVSRVGHSTSFLRAFFPQGLLLVVGSIASVALAGLGFGGYHGVRWLALKVLA